MHNNDRPAQGLLRHRELREFEKRLRTNRNVVDFTRDGQRYIIKRREGLPLTIVLTSELVEEEQVDIYAVGRSDVTDLLDQFGPDLDCIVTLSAYNQYTTQAAETAEIAGVRLFTADEFVSALTRADWT